MRLEGITPRADLLRLFRESGRAIEQVSVRPTEVAAHEAAGWHVITVGKSRTRVQRERPLPDAVELQAWRLMYLCGFAHLSRAGGAKLIRGEGVENQLDVVAHDDESALVLECKSSELGSCNIDVAAELAVLNEHRRCVREILNSQRARDEKLKVGAILVLFDVPFSEADRKRAAEMGLTIFDGQILNYYERLASVIGSAARYQLFGEVFQGQDIPSLLLRIPAVEFEMGGSKAYTFAIRPSELLKISFVAHRGRGSLETYQRMVSRKRLTEIAKFIDEDGVFPTNIVINFQPQRRGSRLRFDVGSQEPGTLPGARLGYLTIPPVYQSAWIIDGQHRLLAYSDHRRASSASLTVTAFDGLEADKQADLFEKINSKQKKVSANLLVELFSTLHWNSRDAKLQVRAIASQVAQDLRATAVSPLYKRVLSPDEKGTKQRCITLTELVSGLQRPGMFIRSEERGSIRQYGVFWTGSADGTYHRALAIVMAWFEEIRSGCSEMWAQGNDEDLGLVATNRGVNACLRVLGWVITYLRRQEPEFDVASDTSVVSALRPYAQLVAGYFNGLSTEEIQALRRHYGTGAPAEIAYSIGRVIREQHEGFAPDGLMEWMESKSRVDVSEAQKLCTDLEQRLLLSVVGRLKQEYGEDGWWGEVPLSIRQEAVARKEEEAGDHPREMFFYLIDLRTIIDKKWVLFQQSHAIGPGSKDDKTKWLVKLNDTRRRADHAGGARLRLEDVEFVKELDATLRQRGI
jgi:DNA sulfur modification protein DndB